MFALFFSLYLAMFTGTFTAYRLADINYFLIPSVNSISKFLTSLFNNVDTPMETLGTDLFSWNSYYPNVPAYLPLVSFILALITSIGIVVVAVKGIKRVFGVFFMGIR